MGNCLGSPAAAGKPKGVSMQAKGKSGGMSQKEALTRGSIIRKAKAKRVAIAAEAIANEADVVINQVEKSREVLRLINGSISNNLLFEHLPGSVRTAYVASMVSRTVDAGTDIIKQGDGQANEFYVLEKGNCSVWKDGDQVLKYAAGASFGGLALMYNAPRAATIRADSSCVIWVLDRKVYTAIKRIHDKKLMEEKVALLKLVPMLKLLTAEQNNQVADALEQKDYEQGECIMQKGEIGDKFYMIKEGNVKVMDGSTELTSLKEGDYFSERALMRDDVRAASVIADSYVRCCAALDRMAFTNLLGPIEQVWNFEAIKHVPILAPLSDTQKKTIAEALKRKAFKAGEFVFHKGDQGDNFFIVETGNFVVLDGSTELANLSKGSCFGELALLKSDTRAASVQAVEDSNCLYIGREIFEQLLGSLSEIRHMWRYEALRKVPVLAQLTQEQRWKLAVNIKQTKFSEGEDIVKEGEEGDVFYILESGQVGIFDGTVMINKMHSGSYFGEMALLHSDKRMKTVRALCPVSVLGIHRDEFNQHLGDLKSIMEKQTTAYDALAVSKLSSSVSLDDLEKIAVLGMGAFGKVLLVKYKEKRYALKCLRKAQIVTMGLTEHIKREKDAMLECHSPFLVNLAARFKDNDTVYLLMECVMGGELFTYLQNRPEPLSEDDARFYAGCVIIAFEYLQEKHLVYRDLKPENLLIDHNGYVKVTDFGFAKRLKPGNKTYTMCGTPDYLAPELVQQSGHNKAVDWWALGIMIYEMIHGVPPFYDDDQVVLFRNIVSGRLSFTPSFSLECRDLIRSLLHKNPAKRLGNLNGGAEDVKNHPWFKGFDWEALKKRKTEVPYVPYIESEDDTSNFDEIPLTELHPAESTGANYRSVGRFKDW